MNFLLLDALDDSKAHETWKAFFYMECPELELLNEFYTHAVQSGRHIFPEPQNIFRAFELPPEGIRCIILGQDPYHEKGQAMGLSFSVPNGTKCPPSLRNIKKELADDIPGTNASGTDLSSWAKQGVFLLNTVLTVEEGKANSHAGIGWEAVTERALQKVASAGTNPLAVILWGTQAKKVWSSVTPTRSVKVIASAHPSPLSARRGFFGSRPFSQANDFLPAPIDWNIPK